ncbi:MAG: S8 family peptidase [Saprospirales bacterium]|nr:S8 family peptidase [Saprospirales bacterium]MBK8923351.1 S8 family peptidase [Saprospirales bacterium]
MIIRFFLTPILALALTTTVPGQLPERIAGEMLLQLQAETAPATVLNQLNRQFPAGTPMRWKEVVAPEWRIYLLEFDETAAAAAALLAAARRLPGVQAAQWNHRASKRTTIPNDPDWPRQENMALIGMPQAWDVATGGLTPAGDTIVVAVLEGGALLEHPDLEGNAWHNWAEIPGNNIDDDGNGYKDDFRGWNPRTKNDDPGEVDFHGTAVNGIIGAKGNNGMGVTGVNWDVRLMNLSNAAEKESEIVAAYHYVAKMRRLYNASNGQQGAFVVATNASFGINNAKAQDHPLWCAAYDSLGAAGILSVGSTNNSDVNVDVVGDVPTTCASEFLLAVNAVDNFDNKMTSGYGAASIDFGAPGQVPYTTRSTGQTPNYGSFPGTSASAPHVSGAIALLYSLQCADLSSDALTQPAACARRIRDLILENVSPNETLQDITTTGGRLDVEASVKAVQAFCGGTGTGRLEILWARPNPVHTELRVRFQTPVYSAYTIRVFNMLGQLMHEDTVDPDPFSNNIWKYDASNLPAGVYSVAFGRKDAWKSVKFVKN